MPTALRSRPDVPEYLIEYWNGFVALDKSRTWMLGRPQGITFSEILAYSRIKGFCSEDTEDFARIVTTLDNYYLNWHTAKATDGGRKPTSRN